MKKLLSQQKDELKNWIRRSEKKQEAFRAQAILLLDEGMKQERIIAFTGYSRAQSFRLKKKFLSFGTESFRDKREGKPKELLTKKERDEIAETIQKKTPKDFGYTADYWTTGFLGKWIEENYKVKYKSKTSLYLVFKKASFTYHKPGRVYDKHDEKEIDQWKKETKPKIQKYWKEKNTVILCADEMILTTETTIQKIWLPQGEYPKITCSTGGRKRRNIYGFLNVKTGEEHAFKTLLQNMYVTREILGEIRNIYPVQKIILLWDNAGWHKGNVAQEYIKKDKKIIQIPFPRYAPEENPQEHVWKEGRSMCTHNKFIEDIDQATDELTQYLNETRFSYSLLEFCIIP